MKRYELAKREGLNWQSILVQDLETDIKTLIIRGVKNGEAFNSINAQVTRLIEEELKNVDSQAVRDMAKQALYMYASRLYIQSVQLFGNETDSIMLLNALSSRGIVTPESVAVRLQANTSVNSANKLNAETLSERAQRKVTSEDFAYNRAVPNAMYDKEYGAEVLKRTNALLTSVAKVDYSKYASLRASVERQLRWEWHEKRIEQAQESGNNLVWIDSHANCSKRCEPYQGRLYSLDNTSGKIDGVEYVPLSVATDVIDKYGWKNGCLSGFNCRHKIVPYKKGFRPQPIPQRVIDHQREVDAKMRYYERNVRNYESLALGYKELGEKNLYKHYKQLAKKWTRAYKGYAEKQGVPYYPSRIDI